MKVSYLPASASRKRKRKKCLGKRQSTFGAVLEGSGIPQTAKLFREE
jgi:hypothetical protein